AHRHTAAPRGPSRSLTAAGGLRRTGARGYVPRRIRRRAMRHAQLLGADEPVMWRLVPTLVREMGQAYGELSRAEPLITETLKLEETRLRKTPARGRAPLEEGSKGLSAGAKFSGEAAFPLHAPYCF